MKIKKNDIVQILLGKDHGKSGKVVRILKDKGSVLVEGVNSYKRHVKKTARNEGQIIDILKPVNISNVAMVCPGCKKVTRIGFKIDGKEKVRICKKCQEVIK